MSHNEYMTLSALPGGMDQYLDAMVAMVRYLADDVMRTRDEFSAWLKLEFDIAQKRVSACIQSLIQLDLIEAKAHGRLMLTTNGRNFLSATDAESRSRIILNTLLRRYTATKDILLRIAQAEKPISLKTLTDEFVMVYPAWTTGDAIARRLYWLIALGCIQQVGYWRSYSITAFGREICNTLQPSLNPQEKIGLLTPAARLSQRLAWAARYTDEPQQLENIAAEIFEYLGFKVKRLGKSGETDLLVRAPLGKESYTFIVDTKSRRDGKLHDVDFLTIQEHRQAANAHYAVVIAESFQGTKLKQHAMESKVLLLPTNLLEELISHHHQTPLDLTIYRSIFEQIGLMTVLPRVINEKALLDIRKTTLMQRVLQLFERAYEVDSDIQWTVERLHANLAMEYHAERYQPDEIHEIIEFLANPLLNAILKTSTGLVLATTQGTLVRSVQRLANAVAL